MRSGRTADEVAAVMTGSGLEELVAVTKLWPWGEDAADVRAAALGATVATYCYQGKQRKQFRVADFMPFKRFSQKARVTKEQAMAMMHGFFGTKD